MPLSPDAEKRERQLANLKRGSNPAPKGNQFALKHGRNAGIYEPIEPGISRFHGPNCKRDNRCRCQITAQARSTLHGPILSRKFPSLDEARSWRTAMTDRWVRSMPEGDLPKAYEHLRKCVIQIGAFRGSPEANALARDATSALYQAEDALVKALRIK